MTVRRGVGLLVVAAALLGAPALAQVSDGVVRLGVLTDMAGPTSAIVGAGSVVAAELAIADHGGRAAGAPVDLVKADHQNRADLATAIAGRWFDADQVDMVADLPQSAAALAVSALGTEKGRVVLVSGSSTTALTMDQCGPFTAHWTFDTYAFANANARALVAEGARRWFFIVADFAFGHSLEEEGRRAIERAGGEVVDVARVPLNTHDFSSELLRAQASGADVIALANAGADTTNALKQAREFGLTELGQRLVAMVLTVADIHAIGLEASAGLVFTVPYYWDRDAPSREFARRFEARTGAKPTMSQAGVYSAVNHYLKAVSAAGTDAAPAVMAQMRALPISDFMTSGGTLRPDGRVVRDMLLVRAKYPSHSSGPWDYMDILSVIPGAEAFRPLSASTCPLLPR